MSPISVGIDLGQSRIPVAGKVHGRYIVVRGDKDIKVNGLHGPSKGEVVEAIKDANKTVNSFFGAPKFQAAVVVVPSSTSPDNEDAVIGAAANAGFNVTQIVKEYAAVAAAYAEIVNPASVKRLAIVSVTGGVLDVSIISVIEDLEFVLLAREAHPQPIELEEAKNCGPSGLFGLVGGAVKAFDLVVKNLLSSPKFSESEADVVIFVGNASKLSDKLKEAVKEGFPNAGVWSPEGIDNDEVAAYGAGVIAFKNRPVRVNLRNLTIKHLEKESLDGEYDDAGPFEVHFLPHA